MLFYKSATLSIFSQPQKPNQLISNKGMLLKIVNSISFFALQNDLAVAIKQSKKRSFFGSPKVSAFLNNASASSLPLFGESTVFVMAIAKKELKFIEHCTKKTKLIPRAIAKSSKAPCKEKTLILKNNFGCHSILKGSVQALPIKGEECFWNQTFDKGRLRNFVLWFLKTHGEHKTIQLVEELKNIGFQYATKAGISLGIEDLKIPKKKNYLIMEAEQLSIATIKQYKRGEITGVERFQRLIDTWHRTSERLKQEVIDNFEATDILNPVYMMAFSGARGNISQVRQLVGMRGLMSNPQGQIIDFPIRSNFREGLTLTEYIISSYGARKGIVDTALRTANAGYLTRRLVDVAQHVIISNFDCGTKRGIFLTDMKEGNKTIYSLQNRLIGRVLARDIYGNSQQKTKIASRNIEVSVDLANAIALISKKVFVRSALTCQTKKLVCQLCYGWSLAQGNLVSIGEAVGVVAAQSIGEPGTQLTMRTFHTGGVFSGDVSDQIRAPFDGIVEYNNPIAGTLIRTPEGKIAFLTKNEGSFMVHRSRPFVAVTSNPLINSSQKGGQIEKQQILNLEQQPTETKKFKIPFYTLLFLRNGSPTQEKEVIAQISSINRQKNATDQAELTIKSEFSGQFYSKILDLKENKVGPKLKNQERIMPPLSSQGGQERVNEILAEQFNENAVDTIFEAWGWGYAWVLSGKIYQLALPSSFFPIFGDYVNKKSYMNQIKWNIASSFGTSFKLNMPGSGHKKGFQAFSFSPQGGGKLEKGIKQMRKSSYSARIANSNLLNKKDLILVKNELISFQLSKIVYKKIGYFLKLTEPSSSFCFNTHNLKSYFISEGAGTKEQSSILSPKDTLFLFSSIFPRKIKDPSEAYSPSKGDNFSGAYSSSNSVYPSKWRPSFDVFLNWFPKRLSTKTGGLIFIEPILFSSFPFVAGAEQKREGPSALHHNAEKEGDKPIKIIYASQSKFKGAKTAKYFKKKKTSLGSVPPEKYKNTFGRYKGFESAKPEKSVGSCPINIYRARAKLKSPLPLPPVGGDKLFWPQSKKNTISKKLKGRGGEGKQLISFFPTYVRRDLINSLPKTLHARNSAEIKLASSSPFGASAKGSFDKNSTDLSKSLIFEQYQQKQFDTVLHTGLSVNKNKTKTELITFGLTWKNSFKLNSNYYYGLEPSNPAIAKINSATAKKNTDFLEKSNNKKLLSVALQRIFWVPQPFYNISLKTMKKTFLNFSFYPSSSPTPSYPLLEGQREIGYRSAIKKEGISYASLYSCKIEHQLQPILFQINRQGKVKPFFSIEGYTQTNENHCLSNSLNTLISTSFPLSGLIKQINFLSYPALSSSSLRHEGTEEGRENHNNLFFKTSLCLFQKVRKLYNVTTLPENLINKVFKKEGLYYFRSFNNNVVLAKNVRSRKKSLYSSLSPSISLTPKGEGNKTILSFLSLKTFSKITSLPYFWLSPKKSKLFGLALNTSPSYLTPPLPLPTGGTGSYKRGGGNVTGSRKRQKYVSKASASLETATAKILNNNIVKRTFSKTSKMATAKKSQQSCGLFNFYFYSLFNKNFKQNSILWQETASNPLLLSHTDHPFYTSQSGGKIMQRISNQKGRLRQGGKEKDVGEKGKRSFAICSYAARKKFKAICSPYLKDQFPYSLVYLCLSDLGVALKNKNKPFITLCAFYGMYQLNVFYNKGQSCYYYGLKQKFPFTSPWIDSTQRASSNNNNTKSLTLSSTSVFFLSAAINQVEMPFERMRKLQDWFRKSKSYKKTYLKNLLKINKRLYAILFKKNPIYKKPFSAVAKQKRQIQELLKKRTVIGQQKGKAYQKNLSFFNHHHTIRYKATKKTKKRNRMEQLVNIMVKPGWLYYTDNLSSFFLYNKKLINSGKKIGNDLVFDRHSVYVEVISLDKIFPYISSASNNTLTQLPKTVYSPNDNCTPPDPLWTGSLNPYSLLRGGGGEKINEGLRISHTLKNSKCRFEPQSYKNSFLSDKLVEPYGNERHTKNGLAPQFLVLIRKASEYKLFKDIEHKKEIYKIANQKNNGPALYNLNFFNESKIRAAAKNQISSHPSFAVTTAKTNLILMRYNTFADYVAREKIYYFYFGTTAKQITLSPLPLSKLKIDDNDENKEQIQNLFKIIKATAKNLATYPIFVLMLPDKGSQQSNLGQAFCSDNPFLKEMLIKLINKKISLPPCLPPLIREPVQGDHTLPPGIRYEGGQGRITEGVHLKLAKWINKAFNSINLFSQYKTGLLNKQKITPQTISKYPSSDLKVISNISFYSSLSLVNQAHLSIYPIVRNYQLYNKTYFLGLDFKALPMPLLHGDSEGGQEQKRYFKINKASSWGLSYFPITSIKATNFSPLIISYKAPYSLDFPFKTPMRLFSEQYQHSLLFNESKLLSRFKLAPPTRGEGGEDIATKGVSEADRALNYRKTQNKSFQYNDLKKVLYAYLLKINSNKALESQNKQHSGYRQKDGCCHEINALRVGKAMSILSSIFACPIVEYSLGKDFEKSLSYPNNLLSSFSKNTLYGPILAGSLNHVKNKRSLMGANGPILGSLNGSFEFYGNNQNTINKEASLYKTEFVSFINNSISIELPFIKTYTCSSFEGELIYRSSFPPLSLPSLQGGDNKKPIKYGEKTESLIQHSKNYPILPYPPLKGGGANKGGVKDKKDKKRLRPAKVFNLPPKEGGGVNDLFENKSVDHSCMILTKEDQISFYFPLYNYKEIYFSLENLKKKNQYVINDIVINFLNIIGSSQKENNKDDIEYQNQTFNKDIILDLPPGDKKEGIKEFNLANNNEFVFKINKLPAGIAQQTSKLLIGEFLVYGDQISPTVAISKAGQIIHINNQKITIRQGQPIFVSPKAVLHKYDGDFIDEQSSVITLSYQQLKTGDIIQGIPKVEQFFEARTTKRGRLFRDSLSNLLKGLFKRYRSKLPLDQAVRQSFYKIQQIIVDGVQRVYRSQGVTIADKHLEVIVKQMTSKVRIIEGGQTGFFPGEIVDLDFVEQVNSLLMKKIIYEPLVLGITKASLEVDSFLSAASFQQTTRVLSKAAISRKKDFLKGLKENVILGNLIPAGTGYLVYLDQL
jgi:RNA polymerase Rpb1, domain 5/RNA polymerase Rpb1, domain 4